MTDEPCTEEPAVCAEALVIVTGHPLNGKFEKVVCNAVLIRQPIEAIDFYKEAPDAN